MFRYRVEYCEEDNYDPKTEYGIVAGAAYDEAVKKIVTYYGGKEFILSLNIYELVDILADNEVKETLEDNKE